MGCKVTVGLKRDIYVNKGQGQNIMVALLRQKFLSGSRLSVTNISSDIFFIQINYQVRYA